MQPVFDPPDTTACTTRGDSVCCQSMYQDASDLYGSPLVSVETMETAAASLSTVTATAPERDRVFETVPELRDRLAVILVTATSITNPGRRSTTHFVIGTLTDYAEYLISSCVTEAFLLCTLVRQHPVLHIVAHSPGGVADREKA